MDTSSPFGIETSCLRVWGQRIVPGRTVETHPVSGGQIQPCRNHRFGSHKAVVFEDCESAVNAGGSRLPIPSAGFLEPVGAGPACAWRLWTEPGGAAPMRSAHGLRSPDVPVSLRLPDTGAGGHCLPSPRCPSRFLSLSGEQTKAFGSPCWVCCTFSPCLGALSRSLSPAVWQLGCRLRPQLWLNVRVSPTDVEGQKA